LKYLKQLLSDLEPAITDAIKQPGSPRAVYDPISYILGLGGKRIRPAMVYAAYKLYEDVYSPEVTLLAQAVEMFHNFTLLHDDIMDNSPLRRGQETVHIKWDEPTAILSGDLLQIEVYEKLAEIGNVSILKLFNKMAIELCEGQMNDMQFEQQEEVSNADYLEMIRQKTAVLLGFSLQAGAILAGASDEDGEQLYELGISVGMGFQLMDDYLDSFGATAKVGKRIGGDILEKKKTYLWNEMWAVLDVQQRKELLESYGENEAYTISVVKEYMDKTEARNRTLTLAQSYTNESLTLIQHLKTSGDKSYLKEIVTMLAGREN
jgi:geranylgeranyl diphosphate synthase type II